MDTSEKEEFIKILENFDFEKIEKTLKMTDEDLIKEGIVDIDENITIEK